MHEGVKDSEAVTSSVLEGKMGGKYITFDK
jgi:hypothetical protein